MFYCEITSIFLLSQFLSPHFNTRADITIPNQVLLRFAGMKMGESQSINVFSLKINNAEICVHAEIIGNDRRSFLLPLCAIMSYQSVLTRLYVGYILEKIYYKYI